MMGHQEKYKLFPTSAFPHHIVYIYQLYNFYKEVLHDLTYSKRSEL